MYKNAKIKYLTKLTLNFKIAANNVWFMLWIEYTEIDAYLSQHACVFFWTVNSSQYTRLPFKELFKVAL